MEQSLHAVSALGAPSSASSLRHAGYDRIHAATIVNSGKHDGPHNTSGMACQQGLLAEIGTYYITTLDHKTLTPGTWDCRQHVHDFTS